jgi:ABC-2 type transport system ATP-binding protein
MRAGGRAVILTTHDVDDAEAICDRVAIIDHGAIVAIGTPAELVARSDQVPAIALTARGALDHSRLLSLDGVTDVVIDGPHAIVRVADVNRALAGIARLFEATGVELTALQVRTATLEDVFIELTGSAA